jgi:hypothetical protein
MDSKSPNLLSHHNQETNWWSGYISKFSVVLIGLAFNIAFLIILLKKSRKRIHHNSRLIRHSLLVITFCDLWYLSNELIFTYKIPKLLSMNGVCQLQTYFKNFFFIINEMHMLLINFMIILVAYPKSISKTNRYDLVTIKNEESETCQSSSKSNKSNAVSSSNKDNKDKIAANMAYRKESNESCNKSQDTTNSDKCERNEENKSNETSVIIEKTEASYEKLQRISPNNLLAKSSTESSIQSIKSTSSKLKNANKRSHSQVSSISLKNNYYKRKMTALKCKLLNMEININDLIKAKKLNFLSNLIINEQLLSILIIIVSMYFLSVFLWIQGVEKIKENNFRNSSIKSKGTTNKYSSGLPEEHSIKNVCQSYAFGIVFVNIFDYVLIFLKVLALIANLCVAFVYYVKFRSYFIKPLLNTFKSDYESENSSYTSKVIEFNSFVLIYKTMNRKFEKENQVNYKYYYEKLYFVRYYVLFAVFYSFFASINVIRDISIKFFQIDTNKDQESPYKELIFNNTSLFEKDKTLVTLNHLFLSDKEHSSESIMDYFSLNKIIAHSLKLIVFALFSFQHVKIILKLKSSKTQISEMHIAEV